VTTLGVLVWLHLFLLCSVESFLLVLSSEGIECWGLKKSVSGSNDGSWPRQYSPRTRRRRRRARGGKHRIRQVVAARATMPFMVYGFGARGRIVPLVGVRLRRIALPWIHLLAIECRLRVWRQRRIEAQDGTLRVDRRRIRTRVRRNVRWCCGVGGCNRRPSIGY
jgi:hypothetical protein